MEEVVVWVTVVEQLGMVVIVTLGVTEPETVVRIINKFVRIRYHLLVTILQILVVVLVVVLSAI